MHKLGPKELVSKAFSGLSMHKKKGWFCNHLQELAQADAVERHRAREKESVGFLWDFCRFFCLRRLCQERKREEMIILAKRHEVHQHRIHAVSIPQPRTPVRESAKTYR